MLSVRRGQPPIYALEAGFVRVLGHPDRVGLHSARLVEPAVEARGQRPLARLGRG
jgi:hypothetical protein